MFKYMYIHWHCISIPLGMKAYDYCGSPFMAVRAAQKFYPQFSNTQLSCSDGTKLHLGNVFCFYQKCTVLIFCHIISENNHTELPLNWFSCFFRTVGPSLDCFCSRDGVRYSSIPSVPSNPSPRPQ